MKASDYRSLKKINVKRHKLLLLVEDLERILSKLKVDGYVEESTSADEVIKKQEEIDSIHVQIAMLKTFEDKVIAVNERRKKSDFVSVVKVVEKKVEMIEGRVSEEKNWGAAIEVMPEAVKIEEKKVEETEPAVVVKSTKKAPKEGSKSAEIFKRLLAGEKSGQIVKEMGVRYPQVFYVRLNYIDTGVEEK